MAFQKKNLKRVNEDEEEDFDDDNFENEEEEIKRSVSKPVQKNYLPDLPAPKQKEEKSFEDKVEEAFINHEERIKELESFLFRLRRL